MRGKASACCTPSTAVWITPAYAGKSNSQWQHNQALGDHPRVCGEKACMQCTLQGHGGSPPRMRGKATSQRPAACRRRIHPRVCGEKAVRPLPVAHALGSPPRMRGKEFQVVGHTDTPGITPAYAGKRLANLYWGRGHWDHPRVCGEKIKYRCFHAAGPGSPPRMRGKGNIALRRVAVAGITPAYAGKSLSEEIRRFPPRDHPRVCGEKAF